MPGLWAGLLFSAGIGLASAVGWPGLLSFAVLALYPRWPRMALLGAFFPVGVLAYLLANHPMPDGVAGLRNTNVLVVAEALDTNLIRVVQLNEDGLQACSGVVKYRGRWLSRRDRFAMAGHMDSAGCFRPWATMRTEKFSWFSGPRKWIRHQLLLWTSSPENYGLALGFVIGDRSQIPPGLLRDFRSTGLMHLLAISGLHIGLIFLLFAAVLSLARIPRKHALLVASALIWVYTLLVGAPASAIRASLLLTAFALAFAAGRRVMPLNILGAAALITLFVNPNWLFDIGFQMSYAATFGILYYTKGLSWWLSGSWCKKWLVAPLFITFAAQVFVAPLLIRHFGRLSLWAFPLNIVAVPVLFWVMTQWALFFLALPLHLGWVFAANANAGLEVLAAIVRAAAGTSDLGIKTPGMPWFAAWVWWGLAIGARPLVSIWLRKTGLARRRPSVP